MKRKICYVLFLVLLVALVATLFACRPTPEQPAAPTVAEEQKTILFLGDSIGEAIAGATPLTEREGYGYYGIIGNINNYAFYNRAVTGHTTEDLKNLVNREDDGINMVKSLIKTADIIHISIVGNDFLNSSHGQMIVDMSNDVYDSVISRQITAKANLEATFDRIRELNPNAVIITQTLYNPVGLDNPLITYYARRKLAEKGVGAEGYHAVMDKLIREINKILTEYMEEHTVTDQNGNTVAPFELLDVYSTFEDIYQNDNERWQRLFCEDGIHPLPEGQALIAEMIQEKLVSLGLAAPNALHNYKKDKVSQLKRLFPQHTAPEEVRNAIMRAADFGSVTKAYFDGTASYVPQPLPVTTSKEGATFAVTKTFEISYFELFGSEYTGTIDTEKAEIVFYANGEYHLYAPLSKIVLELLKYKIRQEGSINANYEYDFDLAIPYFSNFAPGVDKYDLENVLKAIEEYHGFKIVGLDYDNPALQAVFDNYAATGQLVIDSPSIFGKTVGLLSTGVYTLNTVTDADGKAYTAIYVNNQSGRGESFVRYTYTNDGEEKVRATVDVIRLALEGTLREDD